MRNETPLNVVYRMHRPAVVWWPFKRGLRRLLPLIVHRYAAHFYHSGYGWGYESAFTRRTCQRRFDDMCTWFRETS